MAAFSLQVCVLRKFESGVLSGISHGNWGYWTWLSYLPSPNKNLLKVLISLAKNVTYWRSQGRFESERHGCGKIPGFFQVLYDPDLFTPCSKPQKQHFACGLIILFLHWNRKPRLSQFQKYALKMIFYVISKTVTLNWFPCQNHLHKIDVSHCTLTF